MRLQDRYLACGDINERVTRYDEYMKYVVHWIMPSKPCDMQFKNVNFTEQCEKILYNSEIVYNFESFVW